MGANGIAISADGRTLVTAETFADKITAFDVTPDGKLTGKRTFAEMQGGFPDGLCLDEQGAVWTALTAAGRVVRVVEGGEIVAEVSPAASESGVSPPAVSAARTGARSTSAAGLKSSTPTNRGARPKARSGPRGCPYRAARRVPDPNEVKEIR